MKVDAPVSTMNVPFSVRNRSMTKSNSRWSTLPSFKRFSLLTANPRYSASVWLTGSASMASTSCPFDDKYCDRMADTRLFFFFQAEDGIRYLDVTGVQTCALPILDVQRRRQGRQLRSEAVMAAQPARVAE